MAYVDQLSYFNSAWENATAEVLDAAAADHYEVIFPIPVVIMQFGFIVTEIVGDATTEAVVALDYRPAQGSDTGRVEKATLSFSGGTIGSAVGDVIYVVDANDNSVFDPFTVNVGQSIVFEHKTQASGGTTTGQGHYFVTYRPYYETVANFTAVDQVAS